MRTLSPLTRGLALALAQVLIVSALGAKLLVDRARYSRVWVETAPVDPDLPIRGRYVQLRLKMSAEGLTVPPYARSAAELVVEDGALVARATSKDDATWVEFPDANDPSAVILGPTIAFFIPEDVADPSIRPAGETLWAEVTIPPTGPPRPIRLGIQRGDGPVEPLDLRAP